MQELKEALGKFADDTFDELKEDSLKNKPEEIPEAKELREGAKKWATICIKYHDGKLLEKGLRVTMAICEYLNEFERIE